LALVFRYISRNKVNEVFGNIDENLLEDILKVLDPSLHTYFYACLDSNGAKYTWKYYEQSRYDLIQNVMHGYETDYNRYGIENKKMLWRFVKDLADNIKYKERIIDGLMWVINRDKQSDVLGVIVNGVNTESECLPRLITGEFLKSILEKEEIDNEKKHRIIDKVMKLLRYFKSADAAKDVVSAITNMKGFAEALLIEKEENMLLVKVLNVISNKDTARTVVQKCAVDIKNSRALAQAANNVKDKEIVYYMMELIKQNGTLMDQEILSLLRHDIVSVVLYGVHDDALGKLKPRLVENHEVAEILGYFTQHGAIDILGYAPEPAAEILKYMRWQDKDAIDNMVKDISLARRLNGIGTDDIGQLKKMFHYSERGMTLMLFKHLNYKALNSIVDVIMNPNENKLFLIELSDSITVPTLKSTEVYLYDVQEIIDKLWRVYGVGRMLDLLLDMSDEERKMVLKQLGHGYEICALLYVGTNEKYKDEGGKMNGVRRIFNAIEDERRNELLNDIIYKNGLYLRKFNDLMKVLKDASVGYNKIAYMLLGIKYKSQVSYTIGYISKQHGDEYAADILLSIHNCNHLRSIVSDIKDDPVLIAEILSGADDIGKLSRLLNDVQSGIIKEKLQIVLTEFVINDNIVNELTNKPENEQNEILWRINNIQPVVADKIKCAIKEIQLVQSIRREFVKKIFYKCLSALYNINKNLDSSNYEELEKDKAYIKAVMRMIKTIDKLLSKKLADSNGLKMNRVAENGKIL